MRFLPSLALTLLFSASCLVAADSEDGLTLRLLAYNIKHGRGMDGKVDLDRIAAVIAKSKPDLVALQEVDKNCTRSGNQDIAAVLGEKLGMEHRFGKFMDFQGGEYGLAVLSRFPITSATRHQLPEGAEPRCALEIQVEIKGLATPLSFVSIHNDWTKPEFRVPQVKTLHAALAERTHPIILAGDFNTQPNTPSMNFLAQSGWQILDKQGAKTFPSDNPRVEIDYFVIRNLANYRVEQRVIAEPVASDHCPLEAVMSFSK